MSRRLHRARLSVAGPVSANGTEPLAVPFGAFRGAEAESGDRAAGADRRGEEGAEEEQRAAAAAPPGLFPAEGTGKTPSYVGLASVHRSRRRAGA